MKKVISNIGKKIMGIITRISPKLNTSILFFIRTKKIPNLKNPKTFNEKTTYLKIHDYANNELVSKCADKYAVREYIENKIDENILNEIYGVYDNFDDIKFEQLPNKFALKCTHGCAYNIICDDKSKLDINEARKKVNRWMKEKYGYATSELQYIHIKPRIIIEKYLCDEDGRMPTDYKFYCLNGKSVGCMVCTDRKLGTHDFYCNFYDNDWKELLYFKEKLRNTNEIEKPESYDKMVEYAEKLSKDFPFVRVDFYSDRGKIIFGELTFTPACCCNPKYSSFGNEELGKILDIDKYLKKSK